MRTALIQRFNLVDGKLVAHEDGEFCFYYELLSECNQEVAYHIQSNTNLCNTINFLNEKIREMEKPRP